MGLQSIFCCVLSVILASSNSVAWQQQHYTAAVYEHTRLGDDNSDDAAAVIKANLEYYERAAKAAGQRGADIVLFPEYGIFPPLNRSQTKKYLEFVPNPRAVSARPCDEPDLYSSRPILYSLSCMAKKNKIVLVANMGSVEKCGNAIECPEDGDLHFNTNVVFDTSGTLIARYYKERLFFESGMDLPRQKQNPIFETEFGKFATFICFDIMWEKMTMVARLQDVDAILFSTMWMNSSPFYISTQWWQAWAMSNNVTFLVSNINLPGHFTTGSGIFRGRKGSVGHTLNPDAVPKLVIATLPRHRGDITSTSNIIAILKNGTEEWEGNGKDIPEVCAYNILGPSKNIYKDYRCVNELVQNYTLIKLQNSADNLEVCHNNMCCSLDYVASNMNESFYLGVYNGTHNAFNKYFWWEENCFLARCDDVNGTACSTFPMLSHTLFHRISMVANFTSKRVYPSFVGNRARILSVENWTFEKKKYWSSITMKSNPGIPLTLATLKGRAFDKDPPYIR